MSRRDGALRSGDVVTRRAKSLSACVGWRPPQRPRNAPSARVRECCQRRRRTDASTPALRFGALPIRVPIETESNLQGYSAAARGARSLRARHWARHLRRKPPAPVAILYTARLPPYAYR